MGVGTVVVTAVKHAASGLKLVWPGALFFSSVDWSELFSAPKVGAAEGLGGGGPYVTLVQMLLWC